MGSSVDPLRELGDYLIRQLAGLVRHPGFLLMRDQLVEQAVLRVAGQNRRAIRATPQKSFSGGDIQATLARLSVMAHDAVLFQRGLDLLGVERGAGFIRTRGLGRTLRENDGQSR